MDGIRADGEVPVDHVRLDRVARRAGDLNRVASAFHVANGIRHDDAGDDERYGRGNESEQKLGKSPPGPVCHRSIVLRAPVKSEGSAGAEGLEPPTYGFGDRRSTN